MKHTRTTRVMWWTMRGAWVAIIGASWWYTVPPYTEGPTLILFMRSPGIVGLAATVSLALLMWQLLTPIAEVARTMFDAGRVAGCTHDHHDTGRRRRVTDATVIPLPRREPTLN